MALCLCFCMYDISEHKNISIVKLYLQALEDTHAHVFNYTFPILYCHYNNGLQ